MNFEKLSSSDKEKYLYIPILTVLQSAGGQLDRTIIQEKIADLDEDIAEFENQVSVSSKTGKTYKKFLFRFNFAIKSLSISGFLSFEKNDKVITLTEKGLKADLEKIDVTKDIWDVAQPVWAEQSNKNKQKKKNVNDAIVKDDEDTNDVSYAKDSIESEFKTSLLNAIAKMSPIKFEAFSRALLHKMGVEFTSKGIQISNDGGIDGYGYHRDENDFRTTRVVIQCKRYNANPVSEPEINQFLGAMNKHQADYGVFITNGRFTNAAKEAAMQGQPITLIDADELVRLVIRYELYLIPVKTYILDDFYTEE